MYYVKQSEIMFQLSGRLSHCASEKKRKEKRKKSGNAKKDPEKNYDTGF